MNLIEQITELSRELPPEKQLEVLDFVEFIRSRLAREVWTVDERQRVIARTMGCLAATHTSSELFAQRKKEEKAKEERRWKASRLHTAWMPAR
jgi:hypothetical protein